MDGRDMSLFVDQVLMDAERKFGPDADPVWLKQYAREAVLDLWLEQPEVSLRMAHLALCRLRTAIAGRAAGGGLAVRGVFNPALNSATYESPPGLGNGPRLPQPRSNRVVMLLSGG